MKHLPYLILSATLLCPPALAEGTPQQDPSRRPAATDPHGGLHGTGHHDCEEMESCFIEELRLSDDQQRKVRDIMQDSRKKRDELRTDTFNRIKAVLTPEQARKLEEHRADMMKYRAGRMRERADQMDQRARDMRGQ